MNSLVQIAENTGASFQDIARTLCSFAEQGLSMEQSLKRTNDALILSRLSGEETSKSVDSITSAIKSFAPNTGNLFIRASIAVGTDLDELKTQEPSCFNIDARDTEAAFKMIVDNAAWVIAMAKENGDVDRAAVMAENLKRTYCGE